MNAESQSVVFLWEAFDLLSNMAIIGVFYGITLTLYCLCAQPLYLQLQEPDKQRKARSTLGYISLVLVFTTALLISDARMGQLAYINHAGFPGGPFKYELSYNPTTNSYEMATGICDLIVEILTMAIQIWRLWIVWSGTQYALVVTVLPLLLLFSYIALYIPIYIVNVLVPIDQLGIPIWRADAMDTARFAILSAFTTLVTGLIVAHIWLVRRHHIRLMGTLDTSSPYLSVVAMLIESYALESAWSIASTISSGLDSPGSMLFLENDSTIKVIAYFLVVYRVESGRAWNKDTERELTSLQWNPGTQTATDEASSTHSQAPVTTAAIAEGSQPVSHSESAV